MGYLNKILVVFLVIVLCVTLYFSFEEFQTVVPRNIYNDTYPVVLKNWLFKSFPYIQIVLILSMLIKPAIGSVLTFVFYLQYAAMAYLNLDVTCDACGNSGFFIALSYTQEFWIFLVGLIISLILISTKIILVPEKK